MLEPPSADNIYATILVEIFLNSSLLGNKDSNFYFKYVHDQDLYKLWILFLIMTACYTVEIMKDGLPFKLFFICRGNMIALE